MCIYILKYIIYIYIYYELETALTGKGRNVGKLLMGTDNPNKYNYKNKGVNKSNDDSLDLTPSDFRRPEDFFGTQIECL
jgi:hypothetical protein